MAISNDLQKVFAELATDGVLGDPHGELAYCYVRVSSAGQAEEGKSGLPRQIMHVHQVAEQERFMIPWELVFADDHTGFEFEDRPALTRLRHEFKRSNRQANAVIVENLDRLSRNADWHQGLLLNEMNEYGLRVVFWKPFNSRIERAVLGAISQEGMEQAKQRMAEGNIFKAKDGRVTARVPAYGYMLVDSEGNPGEKAKKDSHYAPHPDEAPVVELIYKKVAIEGMSLRKLSTYLEERYPPPKQYSHWEPKQLAVIIKNSVYKGEFIAHRYKHVKVRKPGRLPDEPVRFVQKKIERPRNEWIIVPVPSIVSVEIWERANKMLAKNATMGRRNAKRSYLLTGLVKCASCGYTFTGGRKKKKGKKGQVWHLCYYRCAARGQRAPHVVKEIACPQSQISCTILENAVWSTVCQVLLKPKILIDSLEHDFATGDNAQLNAEIARLEKRIREKDLEDEKLYRAYMADVFDEHEYNARRKQLKENHRTLEDELAEIRDQVMTKEQFEERKSLILSIAEHAPKDELVMDAPFEFKQRIIKLMVDKIELNVNEDWFRLKGVLRGKYPISGSIESTPTGRGSSRRLR